MPHVPSLEGEVPKGAHLALKTGPGEALAVPVGAQLLVVLDPNRVDMILPVFLADIAKATGGFRLAFRCACGKPGCNRVFKAKFFATGTHPSKEL